MLVYIEPIQQKNSPYGFDKWRNRSGVELKKNKFGHCDTKIRALYSPKLGGYANGISYKPWIDDNGKQVTDKDGNKLTLQDKIEQEWGLPKGYLTNKPTPKAKTRKDFSELTYYETHSWILKDSTTIIDTSTLDGLLGYYVMLDSKYVANSEKEWREHKWPKAKFYISLENEMDELKYTKTSIKTKAFSRLEAEEMTPDVKLKFVGILGLAATNATISNQQAHNLLFDFIDKSGYGPGSNIEQFNVLFNELGTPKGRERFEAKYLLKRAIDARVIYEKAGSYTFVRDKGNIVIGETYEEAIDFLTNPKKTALLDELVELVERAGKY